MQQILLFRMLAEQEMERLHHLQQSGSGGVRGFSSSGTSMDEDDDEGDEEDDDEEDDICGTSLDGEAEDDICDEDMGDDGSDEEDLASTTPAVAVGRGPRAPLLPEPEQGEVGYEADGAPAPPTPSHRSPRRSSEEVLTALPPRSSGNKGGVQEKYRTTTRQRPAENPESVSLGSVSNTAAPTTGISGPSQQPIRHPSWLAWGVHGVFGFLGGSSSTSAKRDGRGTSAPRPPTASDVDELYRLLHSGGGGDEASTSSAVAAASVAPVHTSVSPRSSSPRSSSELVTSSSSSARSPSHPVVSAPLMNQQASQPPATSLTNDPLVAKISIHVSSSVKAEGDCMHHISRRACRLDARMMPQ